MSAAGRVITGFSCPYVALYSVNTAGALAYTSGQLLARGVDVSVELDDAGDDNVFYADNVAAETIAGQFTGGSLTLNVDGLLEASAKLVYGLSTADTAGWTHYGDAQSVPYVGVGFVIRYMQDGTESFVPVVLPKCRFNNEKISAKTQEDETDFQTQELTAKILRDDTTAHDWKMVGTAQTTEALAKTKIQTLLNIT